VRTAVAAAGVLAFVAVLVALRGHHLPEVIDPTLSPDASDRPRIVGDPTVLGVQLLSTIFFAVAAVGFVRRAERTHDELTSWLALAATMGAFARLNYFLFPSLYSQWIYTGDALRLAFFVLLIVGALREIGAYQHQLASVAVFEERRRMARDLHDGLAQELAYITAQSRRMLERGDAEPGIDRVAAAAQRALDESRVAITALTAPLDEPLDSVLVRTAEELAERAGASVNFEMDEGVRASGAEREALLRIVRESVTNAVRHGHATRLTVALVANGGLRLSVSDNGEGFDPDAGSNGRAGFGLVSMRERAEALGGELHVRSRRGHGTHVEVVLP
jgi:signal transduction histidine kinase